MTGRAHLARFVVLAVAVVGIAACEPPPPRLVLTVTTAANGTDDAPGDGICSAADAGGACTLQAALAEADAAPDGGDVVVPAGQYGSFDAQISGDVRINPSTPAVVTFVSMQLHVVAGGRLTIDHLNTSTSTRYPLALSGPSRNVDLRVGGRLELRRSLVDHLTIDAGGSAVLETAVVDGGSTTAVRVEGTLVAVRSSILTNDLAATPSTALAVVGAGSAHLRATVVAEPIGRSTLTGTSWTGGSGRCSGPAPISYGYAAVEVPCGPMTGAGDASGDAEVVQMADIRYTTAGPTGYESFGERYLLEPGSHLIDAIPLDHPACDPSVVDLYGTPRGGDGDGDGQGGCDIGAVERQP